MSPLGIFSIFSRLASIYTLFAALVLSTLWVSSLTLASTPTNATDLIADAGVSVLNPFLVAQSPKLGLSLGISESTYASLQAQKTANVALPAPFKGTVPSSDIAGKAYDVGVRNIYTRIAGAYYTGGPSAVIAVNLPPEVQQFVPDFGLFNPNNLPIAPGGPSASQLPTFLQPLFTVILLSPDTFTAAGHQQVLTLLPFFWLATIVTGIIAFLLKRSQDGSKLSGIAHSVIHTTWPIVAILLGLLIIAPHIGAIANTVAPFEDMLGVISRSFLPVYGGALLVGLVALFLPKVLANRASKATTEPEMAAAHVGAARSASAGESMGVSSGMSSGMSSGESSASVSSSTTPFSPSSSGTPFPSSSSTSPFPSFEQQAEQMGMGGASDTPSSGSTGEP